MGFLGGYHFTQTPFRNCSAVLERGRVKTQRENGTATKNKEHLQRVCAASSRSEQPVWVTRMQEEAQWFESVLYCIFMAVTTGSSGVFFSPEGLCFPWLTLPVPPCRATPSSCSTTMATLRSCPCGCAGCWRNGDPRDPSELCCTPAALPRPGSPALDSQFIQILFYSKYFLEASPKSGDLLAAFSSPPR